MPPAQDIHDHFRHYIIRRINASIHHRAKSEGQWPDGAPFDPEAANTGFYSITEGDSRKTDDEDGTENMPWWIVRKRPQATAPP